MAYHVIENILEITRSIPFIIWQVASLAILIILIYMLAYGTGKKKYTLLSLSVLINVCCALEYYDRAQERIKITQEQVAVYMGPGKEYPRLSPLLHDNEVRILKKQGTWLQIEDGNRRGWIET